MTENIKDILIDVLCVALFLFILVFLFFEISVIQAFECLSVTGIEKDILIDVLCVALFCLYLLFYFLKYLLYKPSNAFP